MIFLITFLLSINLFHSGTIKQGLNVAPIWNSVANANVQAEYQFNFILETYLPAGGQLEVTFPSQYDYSLGTTTADLKCSVECNLNDHILTFTFPNDVQNGTSNNSFNQIVFFKAHSVSAQLIKNPQVRGGTGNFILKSKRGENVLDENLIFGLIGIADTISEMVFGSVILDPAGSYYAGDYTSYLLYFKTTTTIRSGSYMIFTIPIQFQLQAFPACSSISVNGKIIGGEIFCSKFNGSNQIRISGIQGEIKALQDYAFKFSMRNPIYAGLSGQFELGIYREGTQMMYEQKKGIAGVTIQPAQLQYVTMTPIQTDVFNSRSRIMDYEIRYTPTFPLPAGCNIKIIFPAYMKIMMNTYFNEPNGHQIHYVKYGLEDLDEENTLGFFYLNQVENYLRITNFKEMTMGNEISIIIRARNVKYFNLKKFQKPDSEGYTTPLKIYIFQDITEYQLMALDVVNAKTVIDNYPSGNQKNPFPDSTSLIASNLIADQQVIASLKFVIFPSISVPKSGFIRVRVPKEFKIQSSTILASQCLVQSLVPLSLPSSECLLEGTNTIKIKLTTTFGFDIIFYQSYSFVLQNLIYTPDRNGTYYFDVTTYDTDGKRVLDSYSQFIIIQPNPLPLSQFTVDSLPRAQGMKAILDFVIINLLLIPGSDIQHRATDLQGSLEFHFSNNWANDLGTGLPNGANISCYGVNGLIPISGNQLYCKLRHGTVSTLPIVTVELFKEIPPNTKIRLLLSGVTNPATPYTINLKIIQKQNRINTILNTAVSTSPALSAPPAAVSCAEGPSYSEQRVGFLFDMTIQPCLTANVANGQFIIIQLPSYDEGYLKIQNTITCQVDSIDIYCIPMVGSDFVLLISPSMIVSAKPKIKLKNLQWPRYVEDFSSGYVLNILVVNPTTKALTQNLQIVNIMSANPSGFDEIISVVPKKGKGQVDASYEFKFYPQVPLPEGSVIILTFPSFYNLLQGAKFQQIGLQNIDESNKVSITPNLFLLKITNFRKQTSPFSIITTSIKNSNEFEVSSGWKVQVLLLDKLVLQQLNFFSFEFATPFKPGKIVFNQVAASNLNADEEAIYSIIFTPQTDIPIGGIIEITFPEKNYKKIPRSPDCRLFGGISTFETCRVNGNTYVIQTAQKYTFGNGVIIFQLRDVTNPDQGETDGFIIKTSFDGVYLDITDESTTRGRTFTSQKKTLPITVNEISFDPKNEGEEAAYKFIFYTTNNLDVTKEIQFLFPIEFDPLLGRAIQCVVFSGLVGNSYTCSAENRFVTLKNFESYIPYPDKPIEIVIYGIVNPNTQVDGAGWIKIYTKQQNSLIYDESNSQAAQLTYLKAPGWSPLYTISLSTNYVRWKAEYNFTMNTYQAVPKKESQGAILLDFPVQFELPDGKVICSTDFAPTLSCSSYRNRIKAEGNYEDYVGQLYVRLKKLDNPVEKGRSGFLFVRTYDGMNSKIIERNFNNLDPFQFDYFYPGPLIKVNNDQPIVIERGTQKQNIPVTITKDGYDSPCVLNLKLTPKSQPPFTIFPFIIPLKLGTTLTTFVISVPQSLSDGIYYIYWEISNEMQPPLYTPVKRSIVQITKLRTTQIVQTPILYIPLLGQSLLTEYLIDSPPDTGFQINMNLLQQYKGIKLNPTIMNFTQGKSKAGFTIEYDDRLTSGIQVERGWISLVISGINKNVYQMKSDQVELNIIAQDTQKPKWIYQGLSNIQKTSVLLTVQLDEPVMIYYLCALRGTMLPNLLDAKTQRIVYASTESQWGYIVIRQGLLNYEVKIDHLTAETDYVLYILGEDRGNNEVETKTLYFKTKSNAYIYVSLERPNACDFTLKFKKKSYDDDYVRFTINSLANIFGIEETKLQRKQYYFDQTERVLQNEFTYQQLLKQIYVSVVVDVVAVYMDLQLAADAKSESFPSPIDVISQIQNKTQLVQSRLPDIDLSIAIYATEFRRYTPEFVTRPQIIFIDYQFCALKVQLDNYGHVFAIAVKYESHKQPLPTPYQIMRGLDYQNRITPYGKIEVSERYQDFILAIENLKQETDYFIYMIGGSIHPGYPDLMDEASMYINRIITSAEPPKPKLNIQWSCLVTFVYLLMFYLL